MSKRSNPDIPCGQTAMFTYRADATARALGLDLTRWVYPCGLCNGGSVSEPGKLCATCAPTPPRSRRKTSKTTTARKASPAKRREA
ncbi:MAG: hypothetical protein GEV07_05280 [Streptosporangiales bacterium]|nr:hypothetical protein [Streptosporangiales bacterium]